MELSLITPIEHLDYSYLLPGRFCLAHIAARYKEYRRFFIDAVLNGYTVILDNGTFENESSSRLLDMAQLIQPAIIVAPDIIGQDTQTGWLAALEFVRDLNETWDTAKDALLDDPPEIMWVPQCKREDTCLFEEYLDIFAECQSIRWIGICRDAVYNAYGQFTGTKDQELNRFYFTSRLQCMDAFKKMRENDKKIHFLGIGDRIDLLQYYWFVDSMDTASFFWQGYQGMRMDHHGILPTVTKRPKDYFTRPYPGLEDQRELIVHNCNGASRYANMALDRRKEIEGTRL